MAKGSGFTHKGGMKQDPKGKMHSKSTSLTKGAATNRGVAGRAGVGKKKGGARKAKNGYNLRGAGKGGGTY